MASSIRTLSQLPEISSDQFSDVSYMQASVPIEVSTNLMGESIEPVYKYASRKIKQSEVAKKIGDITLDSLYGKTGIRDQQFGRMYDDYSKLMQEDITLSGTKTFVENPIILKDAIADFDSSDNYSVSLSALRRYTNSRAAPAIGPNFGFITTLSSDGGTNDPSRTVSLFRIDTKNKKIVNGIPSYVFSPETAKAISQNEYVFKIESGKRESKVWTAPASGIFTCYGWLDEINNEKVSNENRWVALLGYEEQLGVWTILQVQPFIKNNYLSYVSFTFPVRRGMQLKVQTGFSVGSNSDKYFRSNSSLANHVANAFLGGVYTGLSVDFTDLDLSGYEIVPDSDIEQLRTLLCSVISDEICCDISTNNRIDELEDRLATNAAVSALSTEIDKRVRYVDAAKYQGNPASLTATDLKSYRLVVGNGLAYGNSDPITNPNGNAGVFSNKVFQQGWDPNVGYNTKRTVLSVNWNDWTLGSAMQMRLYEPRHISYDSETDVTTYHERDYSLTELSGGEIFSDGKYLYYVVSQDCTVLLKLNPEFSNSSFDAQDVWMLYSLNNGYANARAMHIAHLVEKMSGADSIVPISIPAKKGTIFMFGLYKLLDFSAADRSEFSSDDWILFKSGVWSPYTAAQNSQTDSLKKIVESDEYLVRTNTYGSKNIKKATYRLNVDFSNWSDIFFRGTKSNTESRIFLDTSTLGKILDIFEMP